MLSLEQRRLKLAMLPLNNLQAEHADLYRQAMSCWENVWLGLYDQHRVEQPLFLDHLLRQDEAACIFTPKGCAAMILFRTLDFNILNFRRDSYFKEWTDEDLKMLLKNGKRTFLTTFLTVHPDFRNFSPEFKFKELLLNIMVKRFVESPADVISGVTRRDRGIHDESYKLGARMVHENVDYMSGRFKVDLVAFYRDEVRENDNPVIRELTNQLWKERLDVTALSGTRLVSGKAA